MTSPIPAIRSLQAPACFAPESHNIRSLSVLSALSGNGGTDVRQTTRRPATAVRPVCSLQSCVVCCVPAPRVVLVRVRMEALGQSPRLSPRAYTSMCQVLGPAAHLLGGRPDVQPFGASHAVANMIGHAPRRGAAMCERKASDHFHTAPRHRASASIPLADVRSSTGDDDELSVGSGGRQESPLWRAGVDCRVRPVPAFNPKQRTPSPDIRRIRRIRRSSAHTQKLVLTLSLRMSFAEGN